MTKLRQVDHAALVKAIEQAARDPLRAQQLDAKLEEEGSWEAIARFAAACCQERAFALPPWQPAPCDIPNIQAALQEPDDSADTARRRCCCNGCSPPACRARIPIRSRAQRSQDEGRWLMLDLSDDELTTITDAAQPLQPKVRSEGCMRSPSFSASTSAGPGTIYRLAANCSADISIHRICRAAEGE